MCQRQWDNPVRVLDAWPERVDPSFRVRDHHGPFSTVFRALRDFEPGNAQVDIILGGADPDFDWASGRDREIPVGSGGQPPAVLAQQRPVGMEASLERSRLGGRELCWNMLACAEVRFVRGLPTEGRVRNLRVVSDHVE